jgi:mono/diheme cytochrome c family protein
MRQGVLIAIVTAAFSAGQVVPARMAKTPAASTPSDAQVARGKYIVDGVARCSQCHSPDDRPEDYLMGGPVPMLSATPKPDWAIRVPRIAGGPAGTDQDVIRELMTGISRFGRPLSPPMPSFRMNRDDAQAVLAYLKSLKH